ncbi:MAG: hypothetical protein IKB07_13270 [Lachnospiraceae bacterium]|nr:hypothetical protein [Lachnospiraceae bacterium]
MILLITAITPEANAVLDGYSMKKIAHGSLCLYESEQETLRLLVTGPGKLSAAMAVTEYLTRYPVSDEDLFCNLGICGGSSDTPLGEGYLCASVTEATTEKSLYPELYSHPFPEARLITSDVPVTVLSDNYKHETTLPLLYDMEAYGVATALFRQVLPSRCFFYKVVSDVCDGNFPSPEAVTALIKKTLPLLLSFLKEAEQILKKRTTEQTDFTSRIQTMTKDFMSGVSFSATMERKLTGLLTYAIRSGFTKEAIFDALPKRSDTPHKKKEALMRLQALENFLLTAPKEDSYSLSTKPKKTLHRPFRHIYVEREVLQHPVTRGVLARFPSASVIPITHYKDVFNRSKQDVQAQENEPSLILASNHGTLIYPGAPVCQNFNETHFMYTSCIMNCIYNCDYCYLQGMYPGKTPVVFVNLEDYFAELDALLKKHPVYLCCSYDSDLTALSGILPHAEAFCRYALEHPTLRLELRTKSAALPFLRQLPAAKNIIMAFTFSPQEIISRYEHYTPSLRARLNTAKEAAQKGFSLRLCFDPVLDVPNAEAMYSTLVEQVFEVLTPEEITDISLGVFRLSKDYLKQLKKAKPACALSHYPYEVTNGVCHYSAMRCEQLLTSVQQALHRHKISDDQIFIWTPEES